MALEMAGGAFLTVVFQKLLEELASPELRKNSVASKLKSLEEKLQNVRLYLDDAEDKQLRDKDVKVWLDQLNHVIFMADDMVEQKNNAKKEKKSNRKAVIRAISSLYHSLTKTDQSAIDLILADLDNLFNRAPLLKLQHITGSEDPNRISPPQIVAPWREECHIYGRQDEKEEIMKMLLSEQDKILVLPIVGMGGIGKTTLVQLVYENKRVEEHGFLKAWVTVSTEFDFLRIVKELLQRVNPGASSSDRIELQHLLKEALRGKKFLFVLDDVWDENYDSWDPLKSIFTAGDPGSRVIITTRNRAVGSMVTTGSMLELKEVPKKECWSIFVHHAFNGDTAADPELQAIGRRIVEKCGGLPLAIRCLGGLLRSERNPQKWKNILRSDLGDWSKVMENGVLPSLWLSYRYLSSSLKQCFAYCSLFPQDYEFKKKYMVLLWMAEGFIRSNEEGKSMEEFGEEHFNDLVSRSLFQRSRDPFRETYVVHDMVHDLASFVYDKLCLRMGENLKNVTIRTRRLTYSAGVSSHDLLTSLSISKHLHTLMDIEANGRRIRANDFVKEIVLKLRSLRVLTIALKVSALDHSLGDLKMLRYLNLSRSEIKELPDSICSLFHLQTLILSWCNNLTRLPTDLPKKLSKLRHLDTTNTSLIEMPPKMGSLKELRVLTKFVVGEGDGSGCSTLKELGELHHLGRLRISRLENVDNFEDVEKANLRDRAEMKELNLRWGFLATGTDKAVDVLNALRPHQNLERLEVNYYPGSSFPKWVGETSFSKLTYVMLWGGRCSVLPPLGQLPSLRELDIWSFKDLEKIGKELLYGNDTHSSITPFPSLEKLVFNGMRRWKEWSFVGNESACFPRLKILRFFFCPQLESINREDEEEDERGEMESTTLLHHCPSLCKLDIFVCYLLERRYQKDKGDHWHYISHIPNIEIAGRTTKELEREEEERRQGEENSTSFV